jgi:dipeptidyl-peptidase-4
MKKKNKVLGLIYVFIQLNCLGQGTIKDYQKATNFFRDSIKKYSYDKILQFSEVENSKNLTYLKQTRRGQEFIHVDLKRKTKLPAFDQEKFVKQFNKATEGKFTPYNLPFSAINLNEVSSYFTFSYNDFVWKYEIKKDKIVKQNNSIEEENVVPSPNGQFSVFTENYNLKLKDIASGNTISITEDGNDKISYGTWLDYYSMRDYTDKEKPNYETNIFWSPDSKKIIIPKYNRSKSLEMSAINWVPEDGMRPHVLSYERAMPGDTDLTMVTYFIYDVETKKSIPVELNPMENFLTEFLPENFYWTDKTDKVYTIIHSRGYKSRSLIEIDLISGKTKILYTESSSTYVDISYEYFQPLSNTNEFIWMSEKDGWNHLYLFNLENGQVKNQITLGNFIVREVKKVDANKRKIYFVASGKETNQDPYYRHLYEINFDGTGLKHLTPEAAEHEISILESEEYFLDSYSTVSEPTSWVIKKISDGSTTFELEKIDVSGLKSIGWIAPEPFKLKARDGVTDIYGVLIKPYNFDPQKKYPIIDDSYSGPYTIRTPKSFDDALNRSGDYSMAQLGFIVINVDGLGTGFRSKIFRDFSYQNFGDIGCEDHIKAIRELSAIHPFLDTTKVGIYGHSHGGYDAVRALILHPEFYKVAFSSAGCHDFRIDKEFYPELYMGLLSKKYEEQSNIVNASKIRGKLFLLHGALDNNVNVVSTMKLVDELIKYNKDFDLLIVPSAGHDNVNKIRYVTRRKFDFFVKNLMGVEPPLEFNPK